MDEVCTCKVCKSQKWEIHKDKIKCCGCGKEYVLYKDTLSADLVSLVNDNF